MSIVMQTSKREAVPKQRRDRRRRQFHAPGSTSCVIGMGQRMIPPQKD